MRKNKRYLAAWILAGALSTFMAAGCGAKTAEAAPNSQAAQAAETQISETGEAAVPETVIVRVKEIDGSEITAEIGEIKERPQGAEGEKPAGKNENGAAREKNMTDGKLPSADKTDQETGNRRKEGEERKPGEAPRREKTADGSAEEMKGRKMDWFVGSGELLSFSADALEKIIIESPEGSQEGTIEAIHADSILELSYGENGQPVSAVVKNPRPEGAMKAQAASDGASKN